MLANADADEFNRSDGASEREPEDVFSAFVLPSSCPLTRLWMKL